MLSSTAIDGFIQTAEQQELDAKTAIELANIELLNALDSPDDKATLQQSLSNAQA